MRQARLPTSFPQGLVEGMEPSLFEMRERIRRREKFRKKIVKLFYLC
jgi:hypothetical protein